MESHPPAQSLPGCFVCGERADIPLTCPNCNAITYCSAAHLKMDRQSGHSSATCRRFQQHKQQTGVNDMPIFPWHPKSEQPRKCTLLEELGVHKQGAWFRECYAKEAFGTKAPLLRQLWKLTEADENKALNSATVTREYLAEQLKEWWVVPEGSELLTTAAPSSAAADQGSQGGGVSSSSLENIIDWESYCNYRPLDPSSPLPVLLDMPLTIFWAVQRLRHRHNGTLPSKLVIWVVGAEKEVDQWPVLLEIGALLPEIDIDVHVIGDEVPSWADGRSITVPHPSLPPSPPAKATKIHFYQNYLEDTMLGMLMDSSKHPHILVGLNAGLAAYKTWQTALYCLRGFMMMTSKPEVSLFTDYMAESIYLSRSTLYVMFGPFGGGGAGGSSTATATSQRQAQQRRQAEEFAPLKCMGYAGERDLGPRLSLSDCQVNPFRKPRWVKQDGHTMPTAPNGFACWLELDADSDTGGGASSSGDMMAAAIMAQVIQGMHLR